jgi:hypothetical protein
MMSNEDRAPRRPESGGRAGAVLRDGAIGAGAGIVAATVQVALGKAEEWLLLPPGEDANIAPRFVQRLAEHLGASLPHPARWVLGTLFHYGYGAGWGALYAAALGLLPPRRRPPALAGGAALGVALWVLAFGPLGAAVQSGTERPPRRRPWTGNVLTWSVALAFGLVTAAIAGPALERLPVAGGSDGAGGPDGAAER